MKLFEVFEDPKSVYLVMDRADLLGMTGHIVAVATSIHNASGYIPSGDSSWALKLATCGERKMVISILTLFYQKVCVLFLRLSCDVLLTMQDGGLMRFLTYFDVRKPRMWRIVVARCLHFMVCFLIFPFGSNDMVLA